MYQQTPPPYQQPPYHQPSCHFPYQQPYPPYWEPSGNLAPRKGGLRAWAVVLIALGAFFLGIFTGVFFSTFSTAVSETQNYRWGRYDDSYGYGALGPYVTNETAEVSGTLYDLSFSACSFDAGFTLTSYLRGEQAADKILEMGGDLTSLPDGKEYVTATFQIDLYSTDSTTAVMFNPQHFRFDIVESEDDVRIGNYPENGIEMENLSLKAGESGTITVFAVIDETLNDPDLYFYTSDVYVTFTP